MILVTGGTGFLGAHLIYQLKKPRTATMLSEAFELEKSDRNSTITLFLAHVRI